jgi:hypothetical protein
VDFPNVPSNALTGASAGSASIEVDDGPLSTIIRAATLLSDENGLSERTLSGVSMRSVISAILFSGKCVDTLNSLTVSLLKSCGKLC